jgi:uncharacterized protein with HEPN domain
MSEKEKSKRVHNDYLNDIKTSISEIREFTAGMRDKMVHEYFGVNLQIVWQAIEEDLQPLDESIKKLFE